MQSDRPRNLKPSRTVGIRLPLALLPGSDLMGNIPFVSCLQMSGLVSLKRCICVLASRILAFFVQSALDVVFQASPHLNGIVSILDDSIIEVAVGESSLSLQVRESYSDLNSITRCRWCSTCREDGEYVTIFMEGGLVTVK